MGSTWEAVQAASLPQGIPPPHQLPSPGNMYIPYVRCWDLEWGAANPSCGQESGQRWLPANAPTGGPKKAMGDIGGREKTMTPGLSGGLMNVLGTMVPAKS